MRLQLSNLPRGNDRKIRERKEIKRADVFLRDGVHEGTSIIKRPRKRRGGKRNEMTGKGFYMKYAFLSLRRWGNSGGTS